jgi:hypothetical protein
MVQDHDHPGSLLSCLPLRVPRQVRQDAGEASILETDRPMMPRGTGVWGMASQHGTGSATVRQEVVKDMHQRWGHFWSIRPCSGLGLRLDEAKVGMDRGLSEALTRSPAAMKLASRQTILTPMLASIRGCHQNR